MPEVPQQQDGDPAGEHQEEEGLVGQAAAQDGQQPAPGRTQVRQELPDVRALRRRNEEW